MNSLPIRYYAGQAACAINEFYIFCNENLHSWRDVEQLCLYCDLDEERWEYIQDNHTLPKSVLLKKRDCLIWKLVYDEYRIFTDEMVMELKDYVDFRKIITLSPRVTENCLGKFIDRLDFRWLSGARELSFDFMEKFKDKLDWEAVTKLKILAGHADDALLSQFGDRLDWRMLSICNDLSGRQIEKYKNFLDDGVFLLKSK